MVTCHWGEGEEEYVSVILVILVYELYTDVGMYVRTHVRIGQFTASLCRVGLGVEN